MIDFLRYSHITVVCWKIRGGEIGEDFRCTMWFFVNDVHQIPLVNKVRPTPALTISYYLIILHTKKRGASFVARFTFWRPSHCPVRRNEQRRKPHVWCKYIFIGLSLILKHNKYVRDQCRLHINTSHEAFPLLCFWRTEEVAKFSECQN